MVIGQLIDNINLTNTMSIKTIKIQIINNSNLELCWPLEVIESNSN